MLIWPYVHLVFARCMSSAISSGQSHVIGGGVGCSGKVRRLVVSMQISLLYSGRRAGYVYFAAYVRSIYRMRWSMCGLQVAECW